MDLEKKDHSSTKIVSASKGTGGWTDIHAFVEPRMLIKDFGGTYEFEWHFETYASYMAVV
jgi:hypothetical protein